MYSDDLKTMQKPQLIDEARQFGIEVGPKDTKARLIEKIEKAYYMTRKGKRNLRSSFPHRCQEKIPGRRFISGQTIRSE